MRGGWVERGTVLIRLTRPHFAFFRGYLDHVDLATLAASYLENAADGDGAIDLRVAKSSIGWIRDQLAVAARRAGQPKTRWLLKIAPEKLQATTPDGAAAAAPMPSLDEFREIRDPYEMYREDELLEMFNEEYGVSSRERRRAAQRDRLRREQRRALDQLEALVAADPKLSDRVDGWLDPALARRLKDAGLETLADLVAFIQTRGYRWYTKVPKVGEKAALQITRWLTTPIVSEALGVTLHVRALVKKRDLSANVPAIRPPSTSIVPLETFLMPEELDGSNGTNRGDRPLLGARNDLEAVHAWLKLCKAGSHTFRSYRKEAERFVLWSILEKRKPLSSLTTEDCIDYRDFLWYIGTQVEVPLPSPAPDAADDGRDPRSLATYKKPPTMMAFETEYWHSRFRLPQDAWIGPRGAPRWSPQWRPFEGRLSPSSQHLSLTILLSMMQWLTEQHYLHGNPMKGVPRLTSANPEIDTSRALSRAEWKVVRNYLDTLKRVNDNDPDDRMHNDKYYRLRFILALAYSTGMRLSELAALRRKDIKSFVRTDDGATCWEAEVLGKGNKVRKVQITRALCAELETYLARRQHARFSVVPPETPIIAALPQYDDKLPRPGTLDDPLSDMRIYKLLKGFFSDAAASVKDVDSDMALRIESASTHWLRHTYATHALESKMDLEVVRDLLGHASIATTSRYINTDRERASRQADEFGPTL